LHHRAHRPRARRGAAAAGGSRGRAPAERGGTVECCFSLSSPVIAGRPGPAEGRPEDKLDPAIQAAQKTGCPAQGCSRPGMKKKEMVHKNRYAGRRMFFTYDHLEFRYEPYPIGRARPLMEPVVYRDFVQGYPPAELFAYLPKVGHKYTLSEKSNPDKYAEVIRSSP